jgi:hypothetical protein
MKPPQHFTEDAVIIAYIDKQKVILAVSAAMMKWYGL